MTEAEWLVCEDSRRMLTVLTSGPVSPRKLRLFAVSSCRRVMHTSRNPPTVIEARLSVAERYADGLASEAELEQVRVTQELMPGNSVDGFGTEPAAADAIGAVAGTLAWCSAAGVIDSFGASLLLGARRTGFFGRMWGMFNRPPEPKPTEWLKYQSHEAGQCDLIRDIFGNPFRPVTFSPSWRSSTAAALAAQMYEARDFSAMPILADALEDAGCDSADVLDHCRGPEPHVRGCWVMDLVLGKE
ncbi:Uncharacterized protein (Fragment) OS=uncultured bacterium PE=4 SV=1 [Gemmata massiliana]|uniref:SMI1/KNR4 family protein n=1 Tax=Gemmata massiliana TaxID=1210884 RepID=A0A6P2D854_9BACT